MCKDVLQLKDVLQCKNLYLINIKDGADVQIHVPFEYSCVYSTWALVCTDLCRMCSTERHGRAEPAGGRIRGG